MAEKTTTILVGLAAIISLGLLFNTNTTTGSAVYQQPGYQLPIYSHTSKVLENYDLCGQYACTYSENGFAESWPAFGYGVEELTGNLRCSCGDGRTFVISPNWIADPLAYE